MLALVFFLCPLLKKKDSEGQITFVSEHRLSCVVREDKRKCFPPF